MIHMPSAVMGTLSRLKSVCSNVAPAQQTEVGVVVDVGCHRSSARFHTGRSGHRICCSRLMGLDDSRQGPPTPVNSRRA